MKTTFHYLFMLYFFSQQEVLQWQTSRKFFYWRLRRRLLEAQARKKMEEAGHKLESHARLDSTLSRWFAEDQGTHNVIDFVLSFSLTLSAMLLSPTYCLSLNCLSFISPSSS